VGKLQNSEKNCIVVAQVLIIAGSNLGWNNTKTVGDNEASFPVPYGPGGSISGKVTKRKGTWTSFRWAKAWPSGVSCDTGTCVNKKLWGECRITTCSIERSKTRL
jgi:hypothetical protein